MKRRPQECEDLYAKFAVWCRNEYYSRHSATECYHGNCFVIATAYLEASIFPPSKLHSSPHKELESMRALEKILYVPHAEKKGVIAGLVI
jgi:hypothetical protein